MDRNSLLYKIGLLGQNNGARTGFTMMLFASMLGLFFSGINMNAIFFFYLGIFVLCVIMGILFTRVEMDITHEEECKKCKEKLIVLMRGFSEKNTAWGHVFKMLPEVMSVSLSSIACDIKNSGYFKEIEILPEDEADIIELLKKEGLYKKLYRNMIKDFLLNSSKEVLYIRPENEDIEKFLHEEFKGIIVTADEEFLEDGVLNVFDTFGDADKSMQFIKEHAKDIDTDISSLVIGEQED